MYVDYAYYREKYEGNEISEEAFQNVARKAESHIRCMTYIHGDIFKTDSDVVRDAVCAVSEVCHRQESMRKSENGPLKSENNDGYSVSYVTEQRDGQTAEELLKKKVYEAAYPYLLPTGWLSRKVSCRQCGGDTLC